MLLDNKYEETKEEKEIFEASKTLSRAAYPGTTLINLSDCIHTFTYKKQTE